MNWEVLGVNLLGIAVVVIWVTFSSVIMFFLIDITIGLRVPPRDELVGLDYKYGGMAYSQEDIHIFSSSASSENTLARKAYRTVKFANQNKKHTNNVQFSTVDSQKSIGSLNKQWR